MSQWLSFFMFEFSIAGSHLLFSDMFQEADALYVWLEQMQPSKI